MIEKGKEYKYKEICTIMDESVKTGKSKILQLNNWKRYFKWDNPTKQKYLITEVYDIPKDKVDGRKSNGGCRDGAGAKGKLNDEFDTILSYYLLNEDRKDYHFRTYGTGYCAYFTNNIIYKFFGCYKDLYEASNDNKVNEFAYIDIADKVREKARSLIYNKIKKRDDLELSTTIFTFKGRQRFGIPNDELIKPWNDAQEQYLKDNCFVCIGDVVKANKWNEMNKYIMSSSSKFNDYDKVSKYYKIKFTEESIGEITYQKYVECKQKVNDVFVADLKTFFRSRADPSEIAEYDYIIDNYIKL